MSGPPWVVHLVESPDSIDCYAHIARAILGAFAMGCRGRLCCVAYAWDLVVSTQ